jgi:hypothetical protein
MYAAEFSREMDFRRLMRFDVEKISLAIGEHRRVSLTLENASVTMVSRGGAAWSLVGVTTKRSVVQIHPPQPSEVPKISRHQGRLICFVPLNAFAVFSVKRLSRVTG